MLLDDVDFALQEMPGDVLHRTLHALRNEGPVRPTRFGGTPAFVITGYDALLDAFKDDDRFPHHRPYAASFAPAIGETFISMPEPQHLLYRRLATPAFRSRAIERFDEQELTALAHELVDDLEGRSRVDLMADFAARFPYLVITRLLGLPRDRESEFHEWALALLRFGDDPPRARKAGQELTAYLAPVVEARRAEPRDDVISGLAEAEVDGRRLTDAEIHAHVRLLFPTGGETTHGTLGNLLHAVLTHDGMWQALREAPGRVALAVEETLRWESSIAVLPRISCGEPVSFHGAEIPPDSLVLFAIAGANRDPACFDEPDRFDLDRPRKDGLTFGRGIKSCPGMHLARRNLQVGLEVLLDRLPEPVLLDREAALPRRTVLRCPEALHVSLAGGG